MENLNRVLLENVLPAHVAEHFLARNWKNEVGPFIMVSFHYRYVGSTDVLWFCRGSCTGSGCMPRSISFIGCDEALQKQLTSNAIYIPSQYNRFETVYTHN